MDKQCLFLKHILLREHVSFIKPTACVQDHLALPAAPQTCYNTVLFIFYFSACSTTKLHCWAGTQFESRTLKAQVFSASTVSRHATHTLLINTLL